MRPAGAADVRTRVAVRAVPLRASLPASRPFRVKPAPIVFTLSFMSVAQLRHGSILAFCRP